MGLSKSVGPHVNTHWCDNQDEQRWNFNTTDGTFRSEKYGLCLSVEAELEVWAGPLSDGAQAVLLFNRGNVGSEPITVKWTDIQLSAGQAAVVRDLWARQDLGTFTGSYTSPNIAAHSVMLLTVTPTK